MPRAKVKLNSAGMKALLNDPGVGAECMRLLSPALPAAQAGAPVVSGAYRDSFKLVASHTDRFGARLISTSPYAMEVEAKTGNMVRAFGQVGGA